jgi:putative oxidoreductase
MRFSLGVTLIYLGIVTLLAESAAAISVAQDLIGAAGGAFAIAGLWTPATATVAALDQLWIALSSPSAQRGSEWFHVLLAILYASLAMLGPGAWSIDSRLFGRRRFPSRQTKGGGNPPKA